MSKMSNTKDKQKIIAKTQQLLNQMPHLSESKRTYWLNKLQSLSQSEILKLISVLEEENSAFNEGLFDELEKKSDPHELYEIQNLLKGTDQKIATEKENTEKKEENRHLEKLIKELE